jgi:hypothetical protein
MNRVRIALVTLEDSPAQFLSLAQVTSFVTLACFDDGGATNLRLLKDATVSLRQYESGSVYGER